MKRLFKTLCGVGMLCATAFVAYQVGASEGYERGRKDCEFVPTPEYEGEPAQSACEASESGEESAENNVPEDEPADEKTDE